MKTSKTLLQRTGEMTHWVTVFYAKLDCLSWSAQPHKRDREETPKVVL